MSSRFTVAAVAALTFAASALPAFADSLSTAAGNGADTFLSNDSNSGDTATHGASTSLDVRQYDGVRSRLLYLRFDLSGATGSIADATLSLDFTGSNRARTFNVYGLNDGDTGEAWDEAAITYANAPGMLTPAQGDNAGYAAFDTSRLTLLGTIAIPSTTGVVTSTTADLPLDAFLNADTNDLATLVVAYNGSDSNASYHVVSKEDTTVGNTPPTLTFTTTPAGVPEPASLGLLALGAATLLTRRRR
jgi:hypothetical protein